MLLSLEFRRTAETFAEAAKWAPFASGLQGLSRFYAVLALQEKTIEDRDLTKQDEQQQDQWLNEGGSPGPEMSATRYRTSGTRCEWPQPLGERAPSITDAKHLTEERS